MINEQVVTRKQYVTMYSYHQSLSMLLLANSFIWWH